jgi:hypothetical protein
VVSKIRGKGLREKMEHIEIVGKLMVNRGDMGSTSGKQIPKLA